MKLLFYSPSIIQATGRPLAPGAFHALWAQLNEGELLTCSFSSRNGQVAAILTGPAALKEVGGRVDPAHLAFQALPLAGEVAADLRRHRLYASDPTFALGHPDSQTDMTDSIMFALEWALEDWYAIDWPSTLTLRVQERASELGHESSLAVADGELFMAEHAAGTAKIIEESALGSSPVWGTFYRRLQHLQRILEAKAYRRRRCHGQPPLNPHCVLATVHGPLLGTAKGLIEASATWLPLQGEEMAFPAKGHPAALDYLQPLGRGLASDLLALLWLGRAHVAARTSPATYFSALRSEARGMEHPEDLLGSASDLKAAIQMAVQMLEHHAQVDHHSEGTLVNIR